MQKLYGGIVLSFFKDCNMVRLRRQPWDQVPGQEPRREKERCAFCKGRRSTVGGQVV